MFISELKLFSLILVLVFIPGWTIISIFYKQLSLSREILFSSIVGLFIWSTLSTIGFIFALSLRAICSCLLVITIVLVITNLYLILKRQAITIPHLHWTKSKIILGSFLILIIIITYWKGSFQDGDAWYHVAQAVNYLNQPKMVSESAYFSGFPAGTLYDFNAWHTFIAAISMFGKFQPNFVWINLSVIFFPLAVIALYVFINTVFKNENLSTCATILIVIVQFVRFRFAFLGSSIIPSALCTGLLMPTFFTVQFSENLDRKTFLLLTILFISAFFHIYYFIVIIGYMIGFYLVDFFINHRRINELIINFAKTCGYFLIGLPLLFAIYYYCLKHYSQTFPGTELPLTILFKDYPVFSLTTDKIPFYLSVIVGIILVIKASEWRRNNGQLFILTNILIVPVLIFNPLLLKLTSQLVPLNLIGRLTEPFFLLIPLCWVIWKYFPRKFLTNPLRIKVFSIILLILSLSAVALLPNEIKDRIISYNKYKEPMGFSDFTQHFQHSIPNQALVISDSYTSYHLPAFTDVDIVSMTAHSTPPLDLKTRIRDNNRFFNPLLSPEIRESIREKYKVDYAVINRSMIPWTNIEDSDTLFIASLYPFYNCRKPNTVVLKINQIKDPQEKSLPNVVKYNNSLALFPNPDIEDKNILIWKHAGMIYLKILKPAPEISFHSKGGTHHVFYYSVIDRDHHIIEENVFINDFSPRKIYHINNLQPDSWIIFSGNGISPLTVQIAR